MVSLEQEVRHSRAEKNINWIVGFALSTPTHMSKWCALSKAIVHERAQIGTERYNLNSAASCE